MKHVFKVEVDVGCDLPEESVAIILETLITSSVILALNGKPKITKHVPYNPPTPPQPPPRKPREPNQTNPERVNIPVVEIIAESDKAFLVEIEGVRGGRWIPKSQIADPESFHVGDCDMEMSVTEFIAKKKGIIL